MKDLATLARHAVEIGLDGGVFRMPSPIDQKSLLIIASFGAGWDHVSVSRKDRIPNWIEMSFVKRTFFEPEEVAMQLHPAESEYINNHPRCLHMWRPHDVAIPTPPSCMVGLKGVVNVDKRSAAVLRAAICAVVGV